MNGRWERIDRSGAERTILVVGEEPLVRRPLARAFALQGVRTLEATELEEALAMLRTQRIDALITDQAVGPISGLELLERAREEFPETQRIVLCEQGDAWLAQRAAVASVLNPPLHCSGCHR